MIIYVYIHGHRLEIEVEKREQENTMLRTLLQGLITASNIDWSRDEQLSDIVMNLYDTPGVNVTSLDRDVIYWRERSSASNTNSKDLACEDGATGKSSKNKKLSGDENRNQDSNKKRKLK